MFYMVVMILMVEILNPTSVILFNVVIPSLIVVSELIKIKRLSEEPIMVFSMNL